MSVAVPPSEVSLAVDPIALRRKVTWRIVPLIFLIYIVAYLDRANVGFAKLRMQEELKFDDDVIGLGVGLFFIGYLLLEIPGALLVERWSARKWFARILFTWGLFSMAMALVRTPWQFYLVRILLGLAEAGFFPGVIIYFSHWFPREQRGRALAGMVIAVPISLALGAHFSSLLLEKKWFGLDGSGRTHLIAQGVAAQGLAIPSAGADNFPQMLVASRVASLDAPALLDGWQLLFIVEGLPAVLLGIAVPFLLTDRPRQARWLSAAERDWLEETLEKERREAAATGGVTLWQALRRPTVWMLAAGIFATNLGGYALVFWLPTVVNKLLIDTQGDATPIDTLQWTGLAYFFGLVGVLVSGRLSDRTGQHKWLCVIGQVGTGVFLVISVIPNQSWNWVFVWLCAMVFFSIFWPSPFWILPSRTLSASVAAVAVGIINMAANFAGFVGNYSFGELKKAGFRDSTCLLFVAQCFLVGGLIIALLPRRSSQ
jgi:ACS family tartrate transporter-like MFS transporter